MKMEAVAGARGGLALADANIASAEFALLPFEPGVGDFTKIVQRVPVRLRFDPGQPDVAKLRPGLSAKVTVALSNGA